MSTKEPSSIKDEEKEYCFSNEGVLSPEEVLQVRCMIEKKNRFKLSTPVQQKNLLFFGKDLSGKRTLVEVLKSPTYTPKMINIFSDKINPIFYDFDINNFNIKAVVAPGIEGKESRKAKQILKIIEKCIENEITFFHSIFFVINFEAGLQKEDIESMKLLLKMLGKSNINFGLVVTRCEKKNDEYKRNIVKQIRNHKEIKKFILKHKMKLFFSGCVVPSKSPTKNDLEESYKSVYRMRFQILKYIFNLDVSKKIILTELQLFVSLLDFIKNEIKKLTEEWLFFLSKKQNIEELIIEEKMKKVESLSKEVFKSKKWIFRLPLDMTDKENFELVQKFYEIGRKLSETDYYHDYVKMKLLGDFYKSFAETKKVE